MKLAEVLIPKLHERFPDSGIVVGLAPCATIPAVHPMFGDILIYDDGDEFTLVVGNFTHVHFSISEEESAEAISDDVARYLESLFADEIVFWGSHQFGGGSGSRNLKTNWSRDGRHFVWSGPLQP